jgi:hypothetical protein
MGLDFFVASLFCRDMSNVRAVPPGVLPDIDQWAMVGFGLTLRQAVAADRHLRARCRCGRHGPIDPGYWLARRWHDRPLEELADQVRCACGAPGLGLEVATGAPTPGAAFYLAA